MIITKCDSCDKEIKPHVLRVWTTGEETPGSLVHLYFGICKVTETTKTCTHDIDYCPSCFVKLVQDPKSRAIY